MFTELHNHGYHSIMDGFNSPAEIAKVAKSLGHKATALTDHGTLAGHRDLQKACRDEGIKPILGVEAYISATDRFDRRAVKKRDDNTQVYHHLIVLARSQHGLENLQAMSEVAWSEGFYHKPRIDKELLTTYKQDLIVLSGCMNGLVSKAIIKGFEALTKDFDLDTTVIADDKVIADIRSKDEFKDADKWMRFFADTFGTNYYVEIQPHNPRWLNKALMDYAHKYDVKPVVTNDCHFTRESERAAEELMLILSTNPKDSGKFYKDVKHLEFFEMLDELYPDRGISFADLNLFLKTEERVAAELADAGFDFGQVSTMLDSTKEITQKVEDYELYESLDLLPSVSIMGTDESALAHLSYNGLWAKGLKSNIAYVNRVKEELQVINDLKFGRYFLIVADVIRWAREQGILIGPGRGSAAGSLVCYALGITDVDPMEHNLLFFRFLDPERGDWPDIDMDFEDARRHEVIEYMRQTYGHVANISTYQFFKDKNCIKAAARGLRVPYGEVEAMAKTFDKFEEYEDQAGNMETAIGKFHAKYPLVLHFAERLQGKINAAGLHPAGIVVSKNPIEQIAPVEYRKDTQTDERIAALTYDMGESEEVGLIKFDFLGLKTLTVIAKALKMAGLGPADLPRKFNDQAVLREYIKGNTVGIFQAEQSAYTKLLRQMDDVDFTFDDLVASNALVRPGAMNTVGKEYLARRAGKEKVEFDHPDMQPITKETFGVLIYQEQLMQAAVALGGFTMVESNKLRRIIGKKKDIAEFKPFEDKWMQNATQVVGKQKATKLWGDFQAHAGYSFNKSHAVAYSMLSYYTMWLKYYYPLEYLTAALGAEKTASNNAKWSKLMLETKRLKLEVLLPHVNVSEAKPTISEGKLLLGLTNIKYLSDKAAAPLLAVRPFGRYSDLLALSTTKGSGVSTRIVGALNALNAASFVDNPAKPIEDNLYEYIGIPSFKSAELKHPERVTALEDFDEAGAFVVQALVQKIKRGKGWSRVELLDETGTQGIFHDEQTQLTPGAYHTFLVAANRIVDWVTEDETTVFTRWLNADRLPNNLLLACAPRTTKAGKEMATAVWSDPGFNLVGTLIFPGTYANLKGKLKAGRLMTPFIGETEDGTYMLKGLD